MCIVHWGYWSVYFMSPPLTFGCSGWIPARAVSECLPGLGTITNCLIRRSRGKLISKIGSLRLGTVQSNWSEVHFAYQWCGVSWGRSETPVWESGSLLAVTNHQLSVNMIDCDSSSDAEITLLRLLRFFVIQLSQVLRLLQYQHACVLVFLQSTQ